jgi:hypothetical protein
MFIKKNNLFQPPHAKYLGIRSETEKITLNFFFSSQINARAGGTYEYSGYRPRKYMAF